jgi:DNA-binding transcriptional LysR family regulator
LATEGSFHRAAERLGYTQSAVSQQIAVLERIVGMRLVHRPGGPRPISLTEAGHLLLRHGDAMLARLRAAEADLGALAAGSTGSLRVGTYQSVGRRILPSLMRQFALSRPQLEIRLTESSNDIDLLPQVERGDLDLTFALLPLPDGPFEAVELLRDPYVLIAPAASPFARRVPDLYELADQPLIGFRQCRSLEPIENLLRSRGIEPRYVFRSDDNGTVQALVAAGMGVALVPRLTVEAGDDSIVVINLTEELPPRRIVLAWHRDRYRSPAMDTFIEAVRAYCAALDLDQAVA